MTDTARLADIVLPATMFLEHNDYYTRSGHTRVLFGPAGRGARRARPNFWVINELLARLGTTEDPAMHMTDREVVAATLKSSGYGDLDEIEANGGFIERARPDGQQRFADGFAWPDGRYRFRPNWQGAADRKGYTWVCDPAGMPEFADY